MFQFTIKSIDANIDEQIEICTRAHTQHIHQKRREHREKKTRPRRFNYKLQSAAVRVYRIRRTLIRVQMEKNAIRIVSSLSFCERIAGEKLN